MPQKNLNQKDYKNIIALLIGIFAIFAIIIQFLFLKIILPSMQYLSKIEYKKELHNIFEYIKKNDSVIIGLFIGQSISIFIIIFLNNSSVYYESRYKVFENDLEQNQSIVTDLQKKNTELKEIITEQKKNLLEFEEQEVIIENTTTLPKEIYSNVIKSLSDKQQYYQVVDIIDGDTIEVKNENGVYKVRVLGIDTPETKHPSKPLECFGNEATEQAKKILLDKKVILQSDNTQDDIDRYDRLIRYIFLEDGTFFNQRMIEDGFAYEYTYENPYIFQKDFLKAQNEAQEGKKGLWSENTCNGRRETKKDTKEGDQVEEEKNEDIKDEEAKAEIEEAIPTEVIKLSSNAICHDTPSRWYDRTKNYTPFDSLEDCLKVGRLPKR